MSDDEDFDDLPMIFVNSSVHDTGLLKECEANSSSQRSTFSMPGAEELADKRAREQQCERELRQLRESHDDDAPPPRDSSGSDGEAALARAVTALRVVPPRAAEPAPRAAELLPALGRALPAAARRLLELPDAAPRLPELVASVGALLAPDDGPWADEDVLAAGALLAGAVLAQDSRPRAPALRALHALLDHRAAPHQVAELGRRLLGALPAARTRLELSDALRSGGGAGADALAAQVRDAALTELLGPAAAPRAGRAPEVARARWRRLEPAAAYTALQLLGRRLGASGSGAAARGERARLLALAPPAHAHDPYRPDRFKVLGATSKLRLLFPADR